MKFSMWMVADWLKEYNTEIQIKSGDISIEVVRLMLKDSIPINNALYVGKLSDYFSGDDNRVICVYQNDIIIVNTENIEEVFNIVLTNFEKLNKWNSDVLENITYGCSLQELIDFGFQVLPQPLFIVDSAQKVIAYSSRFKEGMVSEEWDYFTKYGSADIDVLKAINLNFPHRRKIKNLFIHEEGAGFTKPCYCQNFFLQEYWVGMAGLIDLNGLSNGELDCFKIICNQISLWLHSHEKQESSQIFDNLLLQAFIGNNYDAELFKREFFLRNWDEDDEKIIIIIKDPNNSFEKLSSFCKTLNLAFSRAYSTTNGDDICMLCNLKNTPAEYYQNELLHSLKLLNLYACVSDIFTNISYLHEYYKRTSLAISHSDKKAGEIYFYEDFKLIYFFKTLKDSVDSSFIHPYIHKLLAYDKENGTEYTNTLYAYLLNERSQSETATYLNLHRNSLTYRLKRINAIIKDDLDNYNTRIHLLMSFELLKVKG